MASPNLPIDLGNGITALDILQGIWASERVRSAPGEGTEELEFSEYKPGSDQQLLAMLGTFPASRWRELCNGAGWTPIAASALTWCKDGDLSDALTVYRELGQIPQPAGALEWAATMLKPDLLPENRFSVLIENGEDAVGLGVLIAARHEPPIMDIDAALEARLNVDLRALLDARSHASDFKPELVVG
ncbi:hypothetical protein [Roseibium sediminis]|uniref:hypothetical protein n=1 Tax=Roseibium sediminis TaxID=1775174 RepID=UPI00123CB782|nr:hypothetical protein [Roseibium sediminis]